MIEIIRRLYQAPADDCLTPILDAVRAAKQRVRVIDYSLVWPDLVALLIAQHVAGVDVRMILDKSQAGGHSERPEVAQLQAAGVPLMVGSSERGRIVHDKVVVVDGDVVVRGSFNLTLTAELEDNTVEIDTGNPSWAQAFESEFDSLWQFIAAKRALPH